MPVLPKKLLYSEVMGLVILFESMEMDKDICEAMNIKLRRTSLGAIDELEGSYG